jgi:hypothetical protein
MYTSYNQCKKGVIDMKKKLIFWLILFSAVVLLGCKNGEVDKNNDGIMPSPTPEYLDYYNEEYGIATVYPSSWYVIHDIPNTMVSFRSPVLNGFAPNVNISSFTTEDDLELMDFVEWVKQDFEKSVDDYKEITAGDIETSFWLGYFIEFTGTLEDVEYKWAQIYFVEEEIFYLMVYVAEIGQYDHFIEDAVRIMENLRVII